ncbi:MAG: caspase family protein [Betaproteobacteria bacterium]
MTYLAPRRAIKTAASDCAIRGGEYVAYDRANLATSLRVWLPQAESGDKVAQTNVGEIYEKGVGTAPDYVNAAQWYQKAADQGYPRALTNLGFLYEQGLGVAKDPVAALKLYRKAAGIEGTISLESSAPTVSKEDLDALRKELERTRQDLEKARRALDEERLRSSREIERLLQQKQQATAAGNVEETRRLEALLKEREAELEKRRQQVALAEQGAENYRTKLAGLEGESAALRQELGEARRQLAQSQAQIDEKKKAAAAAEQRVESMRAEFSLQKQAGPQADPARLKVIEADLDKRNAELARQKEDIARLETQVSGYRTKVATLETKPEPVKPVAAVAPPSIQIIDPQIVITRDTATVKVRAGVRTRDIVGRVTSPAGLMSLTANDVTQEVDANGLFKTSVDLAPGKTRVALLAVDRQGKSVRLEFLLEEDSTTARPAVAAAPKIPSLNAGNYYAIVIGNAKYEKLQRLNTPEADVSDIAPILRDRYGFKVTMLLNATRYQMLTELNRLRDTLTDKDSLLIYYAGHGELDRANGTANWLPIDAEPGSNANWISSSSLTEILNAMAARHVLIVADSCYSGALTRSSIGQLETGLTDEQRSNWLKQIAEARSRTALTSGGLKPVLDSGGGKYSVFASIFIDILSQNHDVLEGMRLYREISARVLNIALRQKFDQRPEYGAIRFAGGDSGDFLFVPKI